MSDIVERLRENIEKVEWALENEQGQPSREYLQKLLLAYKAAASTIEQQETEIERLKAYAKHERSLGAEGPMIELTNARQEIERLAAALATCRELREYMLKEIERLRALVPEI